MDVLLSALAALAKENPTLANMLTKPSLERDREFLLSLVLHRFLNNTTEIYLRHFPVTLEPPAVVTLRRCSIGRILMVSSSAFNTLESLLLSF